MHNQLENLSTRLKHALKILNVSQTELAKRIQVKPQIIQFLCSSQSQKSKFTFDIAEALNIDVTWLATGNGNSPISPIQLESRVPVLSFRLIKHFYLRGNDFDKSFITDWLPVNENFCKKGFSLILNDNAMSPKFEKGTYIIVKPIDPKFSIQNDTFILVYLAKEDFIVFRKLELLENQKILLPLNTNLYKSIKLEKEDKVIGICTETRYLSQVG